MEINNKLLGLHLDDATKYLEEKNVNYEIIELQGRKDKDKLIKPRVIKVTQFEDKVELFVTYFSDSLI